MTDRVHPTTRPPAYGGGATAPEGRNGANPKQPGNKAQVHNATLPVYRPPPRSRRRGCCCQCCLWTTLLIVVLLLFATVAGGAFYLIYRPRRPSFTVDSLRLSKFNLTDGGVTSAFNFSVSAYNPNDRIAFRYDQISVRILSSDVDVGHGSFPGFVHGATNFTILRGTISGADVPIPDGIDISPLKSSLKNGNLPLQIQLETNVNAQIGKIGTKMLKIRVTCGGIQVGIPAGHTTAKARTSSINCKVDPLIKIINWTL